MLLDAGCMSAGPFNPSGANSELVLDGTIAREAAATATLVDMLTPLRWLERVGCTHNNVHPGAFAWTRSSDPADARGASLRLRTGNTIAFYDPTTLCIKGLYYGTSPYCSADNVRNGDNGVPHDLWSVGVLYAHTCTGKAPTPAMASECVLVRTRLRI